MRLLSIQSQTVNLVHQSAKDFLCSNMSSLVLSSGLQEEHAILAERCISYISSGIFEAGSVDLIPSKEFSSDGDLFPSGVEDRLSSHPSIISSGSEVEGHRTVFNKPGVVEYPILFWMEHGRIGFSALEVANFQEKEFFRPASYIRERWLQTYWSKAHVYQGCPDDFTLLHLAAYTGIVPLVRSQFRIADLEVDGKDSLGRTALHWAAMNGHEAAVKLLLEKGVDLESKDTGSGRTPLSWAAENGHEAVVKLLLEKGVDLESKDGGGQTPLSLAAEKGHEVVVKLLLEKGADLESKDSSGRTPLSWALENKQEAVVRLLTSHRNT